MSTSTVMPPPIPPDMLGDDQARKRLWYAVAALALLLLLLLLLIWWLTSPMGTGIAGTGGGGDNGNGNGAMGSGGGDGTGHDGSTVSSLGDATGSTAGNLPDPTADGKSVDGKEGSGSSATEPPSQTAGGTETTVFIYDSTSPPAKQPTTPSDKPTSGGSTGSGSGENYANSGDSNPFKGKGKPAATTVFVVDCSSSMSSRIDRTASELLDAINALKPEQKFKVVFFNEHMITDPIRPKQFHFAKPSSIKEIQKWMTTVRAHGGTNPTEALMFALSLKPERIFVFTDGGFNPLIIDKVTELNVVKGKPKTIIYSVGLTENHRELERLAEENGGTYYQMKMR